MRLLEVEVAASTLTVREWGDHDGVPLLFWHSVGTGGTGATIAVAAEPLAQAGVRVLAPDAPGFGRSPAHDTDGYTLDALADVVWQLSDALDLDRPVLAGHSWGGAVVVTAAGRRPGRAAGLVLYDSGHCDYRDWPGADLDVTLDDVIAGAEQDAALAGWDALLAELADHDLDQPWTVAAWREAVVGEGDAVRLRCDSRARGAALYHMIHGCPSVHWPVIADAATPTLLVLATAPDDVRDANERLIGGFTAAMPHADVLRPGCRHQVFADLGARAGTLTAEWLHAQGLA